MENNVGSYLAKRSQMSGKSEAYVDSASTLRLTFEELNHRVNRVANMPNLSGRENAVLSGTLFSI